MMLLIADQGVEIKTNKISILLETFLEIMKVKTIVMFF